MQRQLLGPVALGTRVPEGVAREYANLLLERRRGMVGVVPIERARAGRSTRPTPRSPQFYRANRDRLHHARAAGDQICADRPRAGRPDRPRRPRPRSTPSTATARSPTARARPARSSRSCCRASRRRRPSRRGCAAAPTSSRRRRRPASPPATSPSPNQTRAQFERVANAEVAAAAFARGAGRGRRADPLGARLSRRPGRADHRDAGAAARSGARRDRGGDRERASAPRRSARSVSRVEERLSDGASFEEAARAEHLAIVTTPPITAAGQRRRRQPVGCWRPSSRPLLRSAFEIDAEDPEPAVEQITRQRALRAARHRAGRCPRRRRRSPRSCPRSAPR